MRTRTPHRAHPHGHADGGWAAEDDDWLDDAIHGAARRRRRVRFLLAVLAACVAIGTAAALTWTLLPAASGKGRASLGDPSHGTARPSATPTPTPTVIPSRGTGKFIRATGSGRKVGRGTLLRYAVEVEGGIGQQADAFARVVDGILADRRGWTAAGKWAFQRVGSARYDFVVRLAAPKTVDRICAKYGLDTESRVNCAGGKEVVVNLRRWLLLTPVYKGRPQLYRALVINHEVGHRLGFDHVTCPRKGRPAPVMQQQIFGMKGCVVNGWPYDSRGRLITGPAVP
ncbi:Protein of unknown function [Thermomonospora echinospora]|uniref:DUF3152 domain-containing protein n=1 Tax=Thermomonospora echinospora TaxID=1992 RepID=A0A1H5Z7D9_9ACTN|nr:DUF3152 domain-containing protein [Thermomonospora echinospora]SEG32221.1 Protein of unknown function [Thermomonospora echinospora]